MSIFKGPLCQCRAEPEYVQQPLKIEGEVAVGESSAESNKVCFSSRTVLKRGETVKFLLSL